MQLPDEIGKYILSFIRPTHPLFYFLQRLPPTPAIITRMNQLNADFERRNWIRYYNDIHLTPLSRVVVYAYTEITHFAHMPIPEILRSIFINRMINATTGFSDIHALSCNELF